MRTIISILVVVAMVNGTGLCQSSKPNGQFTKCASGNIFAVTNSVEVKKIDHFLDGFRLALRSGRAMRVARFIHFPLLVGGVRNSSTISSKREFVAKYNKIFPAPVKAFLLKQETRCVNRYGSQGFTVGTGQIWFDEYTDGTVKIFTVNPGGIPPQRPPWFSRGK